MTDGKTQTQFVVLVPSPRVEGAYAFSIDGTIIADGFVDIEGVDIVANMNVSLNRMIAPLIDKAREDALEEAANLIQSTPALIKSADELATAIRALFAPGKGESRE